MTEQEGIAVVKAVLFALGHEVSDEQIQEEIQKEIQKHVSPDTPGHRVGCNCEICQTEREGDNIC